MNEAEETRREIRAVRNAQNPWFLPGAIVVAGLILAGATYVIRAHHLVPGTRGSVSAMAPVTAADHIIGNPNAEVMLVEYSDIDSPYSKQFQAAMEQLMADYAAGGKVAWVYRHFPLADQHPNSVMHAEAAECVASLGDANSFWRFIDALNAAAPDVNVFDPKDYDSVVSTLGIPADKFDACLSAHTFSGVVSADFANALDSGGTGSPYSILLVRGQQAIPINGALPYAALKQVIDQSIAKADKAR